MVNIIKFQLLTFNFQLLTFKLCYYIFFIQYLAFKILLALNYFFLQKGLVICLIIFGESKK